MTLLHETYLDPHMERLYDQLHDRRTTHNKNIKTKETW